MPRTQEYFIFQDSVTNDSNGNEWIVERELGDVAVLDSDTIVIDVNGTATGSTVYFEIKVTPDGQYLSIAGVRTSDYKLATSTSGINEAWMFDIGPFYSFRCRVYGVSGGSVTIKSKISNT